jgi:hypothetical protein
MVFPSVRSLGPLSVPAPGGRIRRFPTIGPIPPAEYVADELCACCQRTSNTRSRTRVRTADSSSEPRQPSRLEKRKNTASRCPGRPHIQPGRVCAPSPQSDALHPFRGCRLPPAVTYGHHRSGRVAGQPRLPPGRRIFRRHSCPAGATPARLTRSPRSSRAGFFSRIGRLPRTAARTPAAPAPPGGRGQPRPTAGPPAPGRRRPPRRSAGTRRASSSPTARAGRRSPA